MDHKRRMIMLDKKQLEQEIIAWRHDLHQHPEAAFEEVRTAKFVAEKLREFGYEVTENVGKTGVVGVLKNGEGPVIGLRADMDCNKIIEKNTFEYASQTEQRMHACGHDGHTATLLGAAKLIADEKAFKGTVVLVFQPAEEPGWGADAMIADGVIEKFGIQEIYGQHNFTYYPKGTMKIGKTTYKFTVGESGRVKIKLKKVYKLNTKIKVTVTHNGYTVTRNFKFYSGASFDEVKASKHKVKILTNNLHRGDTIKVIYKKKAYTYKVKKNYDCKYKLFAIKVKKTIKKNSSLKIKIVNKDKKTLMVQKIKLDKWRFIQPDEISE